MKKIKYLHLVVTVITSVLLLSCGENNRHQKEMPAPDVQVVPAWQETVPMYTEYTGQVFGESDIKLQSRVTGLITGMYFKEGDQVEKGSLLYTIDDTPYRMQVNEYKANLANAKTVMLNKKQNLDRIQPLAEMKALSAMDLDAANADYKASSDNVAAAEARLADMNIQLSYTRITAPLSGIIGISNVGVGDYISGPSANGLNTISSTNGIVVQFMITEVDYLHFLLRAKKDTGYEKQLSALPVDLILADGSVYAEKGRLELADREIDPSTGSIIIEASFKNSGQILRPGQYVKIRFRTSNFENAILVPQQAVYQLQNLSQVYVLNDSNKLVARTIKMGARTGSNWIVKEGLKTGERVAIIGSTFINPKLPVHPIFIKPDTDSTGSN